VGTVKASSPPDQLPYYVLTQPLPGNCTNSYALGTPIAYWCTAMVAVRDIMLANYVNYRKLFAGGQCLGNPIDIDDNVLIGHVYGWTPWIEVKDLLKGTGCMAAQNLLQNTPGNPNIPGSPGYCIGTGCSPTGDPAKRDYTNYLLVKTAFDKLNYTNNPDNNNMPFYPDTHYPFNPWVNLIRNTLGITCAYAYSVDDALGNVQAEGQGFIVDVGSVENLENKHPCSPPIIVTLGGANEVGGKFDFYQICNDGKKKPVNPNFTAFVLGGDDPGGCPIYLWDNGVKAEGQTGAPQQYTFTVDKNTAQKLDNLFPFFQNPSADPKPIWTANTAGTYPPTPPPPPLTSTAAPIVCTGNIDLTSPNPPLTGTCQKDWQTGAGCQSLPAPYQQSSGTFCCDSLSSAGIYAFSAAEPLLDHAPKNYFVITQPPTLCRVFGSNQTGVCKVAKQACSHGIAVPVAP
jgi:hypothetical protein